MEALESDTLPGDEQKMSVFPSKSRFRRRHKRCFELSFRTLRDLDDAGNADAVTLVHGTVRTRSGPTPHAWLGSDYEAYDAVAHEIMPIDQYVAVHGAIAERRYSLKEANEISRRQGWHYGPWHDPWESICGRNS